MNEAGSLTVHVDFFSVFILYFCFSFFFIAEYIFQLMKTMISKGENHC